MAKENVSLEFRFKRIVETRNYLLEELKHNDLMSEEYKMCVGFKITLSIFLFLLGLSVSMSQFLLLVYCLSRYCEFYSRIKNLCTNCSNQKV